MCGISTRLGWKHSASTNECSTLVKHFQDLKPKTNLGRFDLYFFFRCCFFSFCSSIFLLSLLINVDFSCNFSFANDQPFDSFCVFRSFLNFNLFSVTLYPLFNNFCKYYFIYVSNCQVLLFSLVVIQTSRQMYPSLIILLLLYINL